MTRTRYPAHPAADVVARTAPRQLNLTPPRNPTPPPPPIVRDEVGDVVTLPPGLSMATLQTAIQQPNVVLRLNGAYWLGSPGGYSNTGRPVLRLARLRLVDLDAAATAASPPAPHAEVDDDDTADAWEYLSGDKAGTIATARRLGIDDAVDEEVTTAWADSGVRLDENDVRQVLTTWLAEDDNSDDDDDSDDDDSDGDDEPAGTGDGPFCPACGYDYGPDVIELEAGTGGYGVETQCPHCTRPHDRTMLRALDLRDRNGNPY